MGVLFGYFFIFFVFVLVSVQWVRESISRSVSQSVSQPSVSQSVGLPNELSVSRSVKRSVSPNKGGGVFSICGEPDSPHEGACLSLRHMLSRNHHMRGKFSMCDKAEWFIMNRCRRMGGGGVLGYMMNRNRQMMGACSMCIMNWTHQTRGQRV